MKAEDRADLNARFTYHPPTGQKQDYYVATRDAAKRLAIWIVDNAPACRERSLALTKLEEAVMWANAAVARR